MYLPTSIAGDVTVWHVMSHSVDPQLAIAPASAVLDDPVLSAAYDSIMEVGVRRTTLAEVARRAGVSRMTVYRKYDDLPRLLSALLTVELGAILDDALQASVDLPHARARISHVVASTCAALAAHPVLTRILSVDPEAILPLIVDRFGSTQRTGLDMLKTMIVSGQPQTGDGSIRAGDSDLLALTIAVAAQSFVFSARAISTADPLGRIFGEIEALTDRYLSPGLETSTQTALRKRKNK